MKIVSWNVNGIEACRRKGFLKFLADAKPDIVCCQEIKTQCSLATPGYMQYWNPAERPGYSGTLTLTKREPIFATFGMGVEQFDAEGRLITLEYKDYYLINVYAPSLNPHSAPDRSDFRIAWDEAFREYVSKLTKPLILCGDFNVTRAHIDSYPDNEKNESDNPLFCSASREGFEQLLSIGLVDAFRALHPRKEGAYTWWGPKNRDRALNHGSRLDYFIVSGELLASVQSIKFHVNTVASDHCPISMLLNPPYRQHHFDEDDLSVIWSATDMTKMQEELLRQQKEITLAAFYQDLEKVEFLQKELVHSWAARVLAVRSVADANSQSGVDGVRWKTDSQKAQAAMAPTERGYHPLPFRYTEVTERGKVLPIHVPTARDKAMLTLYSYALDPVAEATADKRSFFSRKGRSLLDVHAYLTRDLSSPGAPEWVVKVDVQSFYASIIHDWLLKHIPMDKTILRKFLKAGVIMRGELFPTEQGLSYAASLSPILANMMLDGLQTYIYDRLFSGCGHDFLEGMATRFADDILVLARSQAQAEEIMQIIADFLHERGLKINHEKSKITNVNDGFDFLSRHYQKRKGVLHTRPSSGSNKKIERELKSLILEFKGTQRTLIGKINEKLTGWGSYHRVEDAYMDFRHIDAVVEGLLVKKMCEKYSHWHKRTVLNKFWIKDCGHYVFALPNDPTVRVKRLAPTRIVAHKPCKLSFNPYLDQDYYAYLQHRRDIQKANGKYHAAWTRQRGRCAHCGEIMLPDQEVDVIEKELGCGDRADNLMYIHRQCAYDAQLDSDDDEGAPLDLFAMLDGYVSSNTPACKSPYFELTEYFRLSKKSPISLTFQEIESIIGEPLPWEANIYQSFWHDDLPGVSSPMWQMEGYPIHAVIPSERDYCICDSWLTQGYEIKALHMAEGRIVFRRTTNYASGLIIPKEITDKKIPDAAAYECEHFFSYVIRKYGL